MPLNAKETVWFGVLTGTCPKPADALDKKAEGFDAVKQAKEQRIAEVNKALDELRESIREGQTYVLKKKGIIRDTKVKSIEEIDKTVHEVETMEDITKSEELDPEIQKKILLAQQKVSQLSQTLKDATKPNSSDPLFDDDEISEEVWTPLMRERVMPDNAIPAKYSKVQKAFEGSSKLYKAKLDELSTGSNDDIIDILTNSKDFIKAGGDLAVTIEGLIPGSPKVAALITKGVTVALAAGTGIAKAALQKNCDDAVTNISLLIKDVVSNAVGGEAGAKLGAAVAAGFSCSCNAALMAKDLAAKPQPKVGDVLAHLGTAIVKGMNAADTNATNGAWGMTGEAVAGALTAQRSITNTVQDAVVKGEKPSGAMIVAALTKGAASAFGTYLTINTEFVNKELEEQKKKKEEEKEAAEEKKKEVEASKDEATEAKQKATEGVESAARQKEEAGTQRELAEEKARQSGEAAQLAQEKARELHEKAETLDGDKKVEALRLADEAAQRAQEANQLAEEDKSRLLEASRLAGEAVARLEEAERGKEEATLRLEEVENELKATEKEVGDLEKEADELKELIETNDEETEEGVEKVKRPGENQDESQERAEAQETEEQKAEKLKKAREENLKKKKIDLKALKKTVTDPEALKAIEEKAKKMEEAKEAEEIAAKSAEFRAMLDDMVPKDADADEHEVDLAAAEVQNIEILIKQMEADKAIIETLNLVVDTGLQIATQLCPAVGTVVHMKDFAVSVAAAVERAIQLNDWLDHLDDSQNSMSPYAGAIKNRVKNTKVQLTQKTIQAALQLAQAAGAAASCSGMGAVAGVAVEKGALAAEKGADLIFKIKTKAEMDAQWRLFKKAFANPDNRRLGKQALAGNPTLSKYAIAYGALVDGDDNARKVMNRCGLSDKVLANEETNADKVVKYLEVMFDEDPKLYRPIPSKLKGIEPEFSVENFNKVRKKITKELAPDPKLDAIAGALARTATARKTFADKRKSETLAQLDLDNCTTAIDAARTVLDKYAPVKPPRDGKSEPHAEMKKYAEDLSALGEDLKKDLLIEYGDYLSKHP